MRPARLPTEKLCRNQPGEPTRFRGYSCSTKPSSELLWSEGQDSSSRFSTPLFKSGTCNLKRTLKRTLTAESSLVYINSLASIRLECYMSVKSNLIEA